MGVEYFFRAECDRCHQKVELDRKFLPSGTDHLPDGWEEFKMNGMSNATLCPRCQMDLKTWMWTPPGPPSVPPMTLKERLERNIPYGGAKDWAGDAIPVSGHENPVGMAG